MKDGQLINIRDLKIGDLFSFRTIKTLYGGDLLRLKMSVLSMKKFEANSGIHLH